MTEHLLECWSTYPSDPPAWCICDELRACEARVLDAAWDSVAAIVPSEFWEGVEGRPAKWFVVKADVLFAIADIKGDQP